MRKLIFYVFLLVSAVSVGSCFGQEVRIIYPQEGAAIPLSTATFILGNISPATAPFSVNGTSVTVYRNGGFLAYLPVSPGDFVFNCELADGATVYRAARKITVGEKLTPVIQGPAIDKNSINPASNLELRNGDWVMTSFRGTPGLAAYFSIPGVKKDIPMTESPAGSGYYLGAVQLMPGDGAEKTKIRFSLMGRKSRARAEARGTLTILNSQFRAVETSTENTVLRAGFGGNYMLFLPKGVKMLSDARMGDRARIWLSGSESGWADTSLLNFLPAGSPPPQAVIGTIKTQRAPRSTIVNISISQNVPFSVEEAEGSLAVTFYYTKNNTNTIIYDPKDSFVKNVEWKQAGESTSRVLVRLSPDSALWGYDTSYSNGSFSLELFRRPAVDPGGKAPLSGLTVVLDPGHSPRQSPPYDGAVGPMGTLEPDVNLAIARELEPGLAGLGAKVVFTRQGQEEVPLQERPRIAARSGGNIYISIHNNALSDGENPFAQPHGFSIYYYHLHSQALAEAVHKAYVKNIPLADEGLRYGNYHVARLTEMPSILVESAYMIFPEQEELLNSQEFRKKLAASLTEGLLEFIKEGGKQQ